MSYNIDKFQIIELNDLVIPMSAFEGARKNFDADGVSIPIGEGAIEGRIKDDMLIVTRFAYHGEGSGTDHHNMAVPALEKSKGKLRAFLTWEGGDSFSVLRSENGDVQDDQVDPVEIIRAVTATARENEQLKAQNAELEQQIRTQGNIPGLF